MDKNQAFKDLINSLKENEYKNLTKKEYEDMLYHKGAFGGLILDLISRYAQACVLDALNKEREMTELKISGLNKIIEELKANGGKVEERYRKRVDRYVGD